MAEEKGEGDWAVWIMLVVIGLAICGGITLFQQTSGVSAPKLIAADGESYVACRGQVSVTADGGGLFTSADIFKISFIDGAGLSHTLHSIHKVEVSDVPKLIDAPMPPNPGFLDRDGNPFKEGAVYNWTDGSKALYQNGDWKPIKVPNDVCAK